jgi:large subunit ribosomal protein L10
VINRARKSELIADLSDKFKRAGATFLVDLSGLEANKTTELRKSLRTAKVDLKIVRNTLARIAVAGTDAEGLKDQFKGPVAVAFCFGDPSSAAKALATFAKAETKCTVKGGTLGASVIAAADVLALAELPSREELLAKFVGLLNAVPTSLVMVLSAIPRKLVLALSEIEKKKQG